ncbi:hypothetical protein FOZ63_011383, partial [Perkinsus olseni]
AYKYANFSLSLMIANNPSWLKVEISSVGIYVFGFSLVTLLIDKTTFNKDGTISIIEKVPFSEVSDEPCICLWYALSRVQRLTFTISFEAEFSLFGHSSGPFPLNTSLIYDTSMGEDENNEHGLSIPEENLARRCRWIHSAVAESTTPRHYGEVLGTTSNCEPPRGVISFPSVYDVEAGLLRK